MKKSLILIFAGLLILAVFALLPKKEAPQQKKSVAASFYPLFFFAKEITGDKFEVINVTPAGAEPHEYEPTPQDIADILKGKLLIINGAEFEPWAQNLQDELKKKNIPVITASEGGNDPHIWLSPKISKETVNKILQGLVEIDPANKSFYEANADSLKQKLSDLDKKYREGLSACKQKSFVTSHQAFGYLAQEYALTQVPISGLSPEEEPSSQKLKEVSEFAKVNNIKYIFFETLVSPKLAETLASEVGAKTLVLDPVEGISGDDMDAGKNYFTIMEDNLKSLRRALECS